MFVIGFVTNFRDFQIDDQKYYILIEKLTTRRWYARNNFMFSLIIRFLIIIIFVTIFDNPSVSGLIITLIQLVYTVISFLSLKFIKFRYSIFNLLGNILTCGAFLCISQAGYLYQNDNIFQQYVSAYYIIVLLLCILFIFVNLLEIIVNFNPISRQLKSIYYRFIVCKKMDDAV